MQELEFNCESIRKIRRYVLQSCKENDEVDSRVLEIMMMLIILDNTFDISSIIKKLMRYAAHQMLAISFENSKRIMLVTWLEGILNVVRNN